MMRRRLHGRAPAHAAGFTLVEVMIALAIMGLALTMLVRSLAGNVLASQEAQAISITTELARAKMYDLEEVLMKDGFLETDQSVEGNFAEEGWANIEWTARIEKVELPSFDAILAMQKAEAEAQRSLAAAAAGSGAGSEQGAASTGGGTSFQDSALGGMLGMLGGGIDAADAEGAAFLQSQFELVQDVLQASIRKVVLTLTWQVLGEERDLVVVAYFTDPAGMTKTIGNLGAGPPADPAAGRGAGGAAGSGRPGPVPTNRGGGGRAGFSR